MEGTATGRSGEEKTGGPGGVLRCAGAWPDPEPGLGVPHAAARPGDKTRGGGVNRSSPKQRKILDGNTRSGASCLTGVRGCFSPRRRRLLLLAGGHGCSSLVGPCLGRMRSGVGAA